MTDRDWLDALPGDAEFLTPAGFGGTTGGLRCRVCTAADADGPPPGPGYAPVEFWAAGAAWVAVADLRTWGRFR